MVTTYSVGVPVRNEENTIIQTLTSILQQTTPPREIHVCVNGSTDNTYKKVQDFSIAEKNINLITSEPGKANAWNKIVTDSIDNLIMFCDGDVIINDVAAQNMKKKFSETPELVLVGGANAYFSSSENTLFSKYFTENLAGRPIKQDWVCGRLYMAKIKELYNLANKLNVELMPPDIINEDGFLEMITSGYREIIDSSYNLSMQVATFQDWKLGFKRILAGQKQLKKRYPHLYGDSDFSLKRLKNYVKRFNEIDDLGKRIGVTSLFLLRTSMNVYYKFFDGLDYNTVWSETKSTKLEIKKSDIVF
jgi:glycosyltransferase involved in cell wall biosynthesis